MQEEWVILRLSPDLLASLRGLAREAGVTPGQFLRDFVSLRSVGRVAPDPVPRPRGTAVALLRDAVEDSIETATTWQGLQSSLVTQGFALRVKGLGLVLHAWPSDEPVCKSAELGFSYAELIGRLGPGEPPEPESEIRLLDAAS